MERLIFTASNDTPCVTIYVVQHLVFKLHYCAKTECFQYQLISIALIGRSNKSRIDFNTLQFFGTYSGSFENLIT